ncbi:MAG TPA: hypothetical protein VL309_11895 [Vicinamibacterales bacterium]|nr:hypothetical protein [Vicinamibacterales bacterium]
MSLPSAVRAAAARRQRRSGFLYLAASLAFFALVVWTFARTYYLKALFHTPALSSLLHVHAVVMTGWVVLLVVQTGLVSIRRVPWHRRIGVFGAGWGALVVALGTVTTIAAGAREVRHHTRAAPGQVAIMGLDLLQMLFFAVFVAAAVAWRRRPDIHRRLMLLTIACMLPDALARLPVSFMTNGLILAGLDLFLIGCVATDTIRHRRLHPAFGWGAGSFIVAFHVALLGVMTPAWIRFATRMLE